MKTLPGDLHIHKIFSLLIATALLGAVTFLRQQHEAGSMGRVPVAWPSELKNFSFGQRLVLSDLGWIRSIQDFDFCEKTGQQKKCREQGWLYQMLDTVTEMDPRFHAPVSYGGLALSVVLSDISGATRIFDKGVERFPKDWVIAYKAAYHALYEEKNPAKAAGLMERAARNGAPGWVYALAGRLYTRAGQVEMSLRLLQDLKGNPSIPADVITRLEARIQEAQQKPVSPAEI